MIEINNLHKYFNKHKKNELHVINNVSLKFKEKGLVALLGPSGSGKTTMLNMIGGLDKYNKGNIYINGQKLSKNFDYNTDKTRTLNIGYIFQDYKLIDNESVFDNVALSLKLIGIKNKKEIKRRVEYILDKVGMLRYRYRPAGMLSGGERQRVGIARALVKNPDIILADEPTGNLDSKNSLEIMNIISAISKEKLVILVTHEQTLAKFYATRIIEFQDGVIKNDYINDKPDDLDYQIENKFYLKDFKNHNNYSNKNNNINIYSNDKLDNINIDIVIKNGNFYIKTNAKNFNQIVDDDSSIEFINEKYKKINKEDIESNNFNIEEIKNKKYSSIFNVFSYIYQGFKKVLNYSLFKKLLLAGFFASGIFVTYSISIYTASKTVYEERYLNTHKSYYEVESIKNDISKYENIKKNINNDEYVIPGDSILSFKYRSPKTMQFNSINDAAPIVVSGVALDNINEEDLIYGRMPENKYEIVLDKFTINKELGGNNDDLKKLGILKITDFLNLEVFENNMPEFKIVGISNTNNNAAYINKDLLVDLINNADIDIDIEDNITLLEYNTLKEKITLKEGKIPQNNYEVIVNIKNKYEMPIGKEINYKINNTKLKVVGYYFSEDNYDFLLANKDTIVYSYIENSNNFLIYTKDKNIEKRFKETGINIQNKANKEKKGFILENDKSNKSTMVVATIILSISLIESYLLSRSSFLSKVKEVGIYRAIGIKKNDIYKMFIGESFAATTIGSGAGVICACYVLNKLRSIKYLKYMFVINFKVFITSILIIFAFNILVSILPVFNLIRKKPANILSRNDVD